MTVRTRSAKPRTTGPAGLRSKRFLKARLIVWHALPESVASIVPLTAIGFMMINGFTFAVDLLVLSVLHFGTPLPYQMATTIGYLVAFTLGFFLNRESNFMSNGRMSRQAGKYVGVVVVNYLAFILGVNTILYEAGVPYLLARMIAGLCEVIYMYCALRWFVFADTTRRRPRRVV